MDSTQRTLAALLILGLASSALGRRSFVPRVTLLLLTGLAVGDSGFQLLPTLIVDSFGFVADTALVMVGFLLGSQLTRSTLSNTTREVLWLSIMAALVTTGVTTAGLILVGVPIPLAVLLGCIASATAPAAILDVVSESRQQGRFSRMLLAIVALDDIWALLMFSIGMALVTSWSGSGGEAVFVAHALRDVVGAVLLGLILGVPAAYLTGRFRPGQPMLTEALALVFLCAGLALWLEVSYLIAAMTMGAVVANRAQHHEYAFHAIEDIEQPFLILFFVLAGASLELEAARHLGVAGAAYVLCRSLGKIAGAWLGSIPAKSDAATRRWMGLALMPQAGVAIGMALVASNHFPRYAGPLLTLVIASTVIFELMGPICTRYALLRVERSSHRDVTPETS